MGFFLGVALLKSPWHEERLVALLILVAAHERGTTAERAAIHRAYLANTDRVNNWDLVDTSASVLVGSHVPQKGITLLERLAKSDSLWERRIAMIERLSASEKRRYMARPRAARWRAGVSRYILTVRGGGRIRHQRVSRVSPAIPT